MSIGSSIKSGVSKVTTAVKNVFTGNKTYKAGDSSKLESGSTYQAPSGMQTVTATKSTPQTGIRPTTVSRGGGGGGGGSSTTTPALSQETTLKQALVITEKPAQPTTQPLPSRPVSTYTAAPTLKEKYKEATSTEGFFRGTLSFLGSQASIKSEQGRSWLAQRGLTNYDPRVSPIVGTTVKTGAYFVPVVGPTFLIGGGLEEVGTTAGRARITSGANIIEQTYGVPKVVGETVLYGANIASIGLGAFAFKGDINKLTPTKTDTVFLGSQQSLVGVQGQPKIITEMRFRTTKTSIFGKSSQLGVSKTSTDILRTTEGSLQVGESVTFGTSRNIALDMFKGKIVTFGKPAQFNVIARSVSGPGKVLSTDVTKTITAGRGVAGRNIFSVPMKSAQKFQFASGSIARGGENIFIKGFSLSKVQGATKFKPSTFKGVILKPQSSYDGFTVISSPSGLSSKGATVFQQAQTASMQSTAGFTNIAKPSAFMPKAIPFTTPKQITEYQTKQLQSPLTIQVPKEDVLLKQTSTIGLFQIPKTSTRSRTVTTPVTTQIPVVETNLMVGQIPIISPRIDISPKSYGGLLAPRIPTEPVTKVDTPIIPIVAFPSFNLDLGRMPSRVYTKKRKYKYTPSYEAFAFNIRGKKPKGVETGFRVRPLTKEFKSFDPSKLFKKIKF
jgi:hypothetical protein